MNRNDLERLTKEELIDLVLRMQRPDKTSRNSSKPPSTDRKERREDSKPGGARPGHDGHSRRLADDPDVFEDHALLRCDRCGLPFPDGAARELIGEYDEIELPPVRPFVKRHRRFAIRCTCCGQSTVAPAPPVAQGTPFGPNIHAVAVYLKTMQLFSYERLSAAFLDLFGLEVSEGALMNMFIRTKAAFAAKRESALSALRRARVVACDETGARIEGVNAYHWVFCCEDAVVHSAEFTRGAVAVRDAMVDHRPEVWISDRYTAQQGHAVRQQTCLAHIDREARFVEENSNDGVAFRLKLWLDRAFALARDIETFAASTVRAKRRALERDLTVILGEPTTCSLTRELLAKIARARDQLLTFCDFPGQVDATNNESERRLRPAASPVPAGPFSAKSRTAIAPNGLPIMRPPCEPPSIPRAWPASALFKRSSVSSPSEQVGRIKLASRSCGRDAAPTPVGNYCAMVPETISSIDRLRISWPRTRRAVLPLQWRSLKSLAKSTPYACHGFLEFCKSLLNHLVAAGE